MDRGYSIYMRRSRHGKRFHNDEDDNDNNSQGVTTYGSTPITPTVTVTIVQTIVTSTIAASAETSPIVTYSAQTSVSSKTPDNGEMRKGDDALPTTSAMPSSQSPSGLPVGAVVGIVLVVILFLAVGGVVWFRRRSITSRLKKRQWNKQQEKPPSFLFIESKESSNIWPFHVTLRRSRGKDIAAPAKSAHGRVPCIPYPTPPRPPPVAGTYDDTISTMPVTTSLNKVSTNVSSPPASSSASPSLSKQTETVKVRATFIPALPDELTIGIGEMVRIHMKYDDGWGLCSNARGEMGMLPLECLDRASQLPREKSANKEYRRLVRVSSLATPRSPHCGNKH